MSDAFWTAKKVLVAGGAGFIGSYLVEELIKAGASVRVADNLERGSKANVFEHWNQIEFMQLDLISPANCVLACEGMDVVMNLAARACGLEYSMTHHGEMLTHNTILGFNILEAARKCGVDRTLIVSTSCVYSDDTENPMVEDAFCWKPEKANEGYAFAKILMEKQAMYFTKEYGMKIAIARANNAYGVRDVWDGEKSHVIPALIKRVIDGNDPLVVWGSGRQTRAFVHARDIVQGFMLLVEHFAVGDPVNVGHEHETSIAELVDIICKLADRHPQVEFDISKPEGAPRKAVSSAKLQEVSKGFVPATVLEDGLREMVDWYKDRYVEATTRPPPELSIITPVYCEDALITATISQVKDHVSIPHEMIIVYDFDEDTTLPHVKELMPVVPELRLVKNDIGPGVVNAVRKGIEEARGQYVIVVNGDLSDDMTTINEMVRLLREDNDVVCGTRYSKGGKKLGGPMIQDLMSRVANWSFQLLTKCPTRDATNTFKMYKEDFIKNTTIQSTGGFEFSMELVLKARSKGLKIVEIPTVWKQRKAGESRFRLIAWLKNYCRWYFAGVLNAWFRIPIR